jgi:hypothetical protein
MGCSKLHTKQFVRAVGAILLGLGLLSAPGCTSVHCYASWPRDVQFRAVGVNGDPERLVVVLDADGNPEARPDAQGRVTLSTPTLRGAKHFTLGFLVRDDGPLFEPVVRVQRDGVDLRALTLDELDALPLDDDGYRVLDLDA